MAPKPTPAAHEPLQMPPFPSPQPPPAAAQPAAQPAPEPAMNAWQALQATILLFLTEEKRWTPDQKLTLDSLLMAFAGVAYHDGLRDGRNESKQ